MCRGSVDRERGGDRHENAAVDPLGQSFVPDGSAMTGLGRVRRFRAVSRGTSPSPSAVRSPARPWQRPVFGSKVRDGDPGSAVNTVDFI